MLRSLVRLVLRLVYRFRAFNTEVLKTPGPVLLIPNHVSWLDWLLLGAVLDKDWRFVTSRTTAQLTRLHRLVMLNRSTFPVDIDSPYAVKHLAEFLQKGGRLVLFAEGRISITGSLMKLFDGSGFLLHRTNARVITAYLRGAHRLPFVRHPGWTKWFPRVTVHFSPLLKPPPQPHADGAVSRDRLTRWLRDEMLRLQFETELEQGSPTPLQAIAAMASQRPNQVVIEDLARRPLRFRKLMIAVRVLEKQWQRLFQFKDDPRIGVLLPNITATPTVVLSLWRLGKVPALLNYSTGAAIMLQCVKLAGLKTVITSRQFIDKAGLDITPLSEAKIDLLYLEDIRQDITARDKLAAYFLQRLFPGSGWDNHSFAPDDSALVFFTSGSEGTPKGVDLSHRNLLANVHQLTASVDILDSDSLFNALPLFHSFGFTVGTLLPLVRGLYLFLYPSPLHFRLIPGAVYDRACSIMLGTNTFLAGYARKAHPYDFRSVRYVFAGAEKLQENTSNTWFRLFGIRIMEAYGATECSPAVSANTAVDYHAGSAGRFLPGIEHKLVPVEGIDTGGRLQVKGPNVMRGYLNPDANAEFQKLEGWYDTGDIAKVDDNGFLFILGRIKRFAKVSGEMISLTAVEDALSAAFCQHSQKCEVAIVTVPDEERGEMLVAVTNEKRVQLSEIREVLRQKGFPNLAFPKRLELVQEIPKLGTGKVNHRQLQSQIASF